MKGRLITGGAAAIMFLLLPLYGQERGMNAPEDMSFGNGIPMMNEGMLIAAGGPGDDDRDFEGDDHRPMGRPGMMFGNPERMKKRLNLTDEQMTKIEQINEKYYDEHGKVRDKIRPKMDELRKVLDSDTVDIEKARALLREIGEYQLENRILMIKQRIDIEKVLTKEQRDKARRDRRSHRDGPMMRGW
ncbi:MAG TPA: Spy/CpxP family protein refolding chaperone [Spirochaetota bacterium]